MCISWKERLLAADEQQLTEKQKNIIIAAVELFGKQGFADTTTRQIAQAAGVSEGSIFKLFPTKKELLIYISQQIISHVLPSLMKHGLEQLFKQQHNSSEDFLRLFFRNRLELIENNIIMIKVIMQEAMFQPEIRTTFMQGLDELQIPWNIFPHRPEEEIKRIFVTCFMGYVLTRFIMLPEMFCANKEQDREEFIQFMARALRA